MQMTGARRAEADEMQLYRQEPASQLAVVRPDTGKNRVDGD